jgi:2-polyprenyl-3-methyl-5-hydroxy-6-metoxy-1,4-benzoquinol methylase
MDKFDYHKRNNGQPTRRHVRGGWQRIVYYILRFGAPFSSLKIAEVGCGTGSFALPLKLLGADATLIDADQNALETARQAYRLYGCDATFLLCDVTQPVSESLAGKFDVVTSNGLAEHFIGEERTKCFAYHRNLSREKGFARIGVRTDSAHFIAW